MSTVTTRSVYPIVPLVFTSLPSAAVTALLVLLMHGLIATDTVPEEQEPAIVAEIIIPDPDPIELRLEEPVTRPDDAAPPPAWISPVNAVEPSDDALVVLIPGPGAPGKDDIEVGTGGGGVVAYLKTQPIYPSRALTRGIEGYVDLHFDVTAAGSTTNIRVIAAQPQGIFEKSAISALKKWKYKVPVVDGEPQAQVDMMTRMSFALED